MYCLCELGGSLSHWRWSHERHFEQASLPHDLDFVTQYISIILSDQGSNTYFGHKLRIYNYKNIELRIAIVPRNSFIDKISFTNVLDDQIARGIFYFMIVIQFDVK